MGNNIKDYNKTSFLRRLTGFTIVLGVLLVGSFVVSGNLESKADSTLDVTATATEVENYLSSNPGASLNDIFGNFNSDSIIELPNGDYYLSDNLIINKRLILRGAANTVPQNVIIDGGSYWNGSYFENGYYVDLAYPGSMIEGVTLTHLGTSTIDFSNFENDIFTGGNKGFSIAVRSGATLNRNIITDNVGNFYSNDYGSMIGGAIIGLFSGTLSGNLIAHNGITYWTCSQQDQCESTREIVQSVGTSHLVGNTIVNNVSLQPRNFNGDPYYYNVNGERGTVNLWDDPILENNVIVDNESTFRNNYGSDYQVTMNFLTQPQFTSPATVRYKDNWIHKATENNFIGQDGGWGLFVNNPGYLGSYSVYGDPAPDYDYTPLSADLVDRGTDVFYPEIPKDLNGSQHYLGAKPDLGAYESVGAVPQFTQFSDDIVYVRVHGGGAKDGSSWANAIDGNAVGGPQNALIAAVRGGAHQIWFQQGDYNVPGRELLYTRTLSNYYIEDAFVGGTWAGILLAPVYYGDPSIRSDMKIFGGFSGTETSIDQRPSFTYVNPEGTEIGTKLMGASIDSTTHFIGERGLAVTGPALLNPTDDVPLIYGKIQPDKLNLVNQDAATFRAPTLPSQGVHVISQAEMGRSAADGTFKPEINGVEVSNGFDAIYTAFGSEASMLDSSVYGGAGIYMHGGYLNHVYVHDNYDAVATFFTMFMTCGGGIFLMGGAIDNAVVVNNVSETTGGGILLDGAKLSNSYIAGNYAFKEGGGVHTGSIHNGTSIPPEIYNTVITDNHALALATEMYSDPTGNGGGLWMTDANYTIVRDTTVFNNSATSIDGFETQTGLGDNIYFGGGELINTVSLAAKHNSRFDVNDTVNSSSAIPGTDIYVADANSANQISYSAFGTTAASGAAAFGDTVLTGLTNFDSIFENVSARNFRLAKGSPLIGTGVAYSDITADIAGVARSKTDIGAYTSPGDPYIPPLNDNNNNGSGLVSDGRSTPKVPNTGLEEVFKSAESKASLSTILKYIQMAIGTIMLVSISVIVCRKNDSDLKLRKQC